MLASATSANRKLGNHFHTWLGGCHRELDKTCMYREPMPAEAMLRLRKLFGFANTFYKRVSDGSRTVEVLLPPCHVVMVIFILTFFV